MIQTIKVGSISEWEAVGALPDGQLCWAPDAGVLKIGNGLRGWNALPIHIEALSYK